MSDENRTQKPTARRLEALRRDQQFPHSRTLSAAVAFGVAAWLVPGSLTQLGLKCQAHLLAILARPADFEGAHVGMRALDFGSALLLCLVRLLAAPLIAFVVCSAIQTRGVTLKFPSFRPGTFHFALSPARVFDAWGDALVTQIWLVLAPVGALFWLLRRHVQHVLSARHSTAALTEGLLAISSDFLWVVFAIVMACGLFDYARRLASFRKRARMTREEVAREAKEQYGAPELIAHRRELQKKLSQDPRLSPR